MIKEQERQFFALKSGEPHRVSMNGNKLSMSNIPKEVRDKLMERIAEKDEVMAQGLKGILPGLKIDGKEVTKENIKDFEIKSKKEVPKEIIKEVPKEIPKKKKEYTKAQLGELTFKELKVIGGKLGTTDRSKKNLIKEILKLQ